MRDLDQQLAGRNGFEYVLTKCFFLDRIRELLGDFIVDVRVEQRLPHLLQGFRHVNFRDPAFPFEKFKSLFKFIA